MIVQNLFQSNESYTHENWVYRNVSVALSRLYYIIDGEAYCEENGKKTRLKKGYLYLTPVHVPCTFYDNPKDRLLHTYAHITTVPAVTRLMEIPVKEGTLLADAVALWRKHVHVQEPERLIPILQLVLSALEEKDMPSDTVAGRAKRYIDSLENFSFRMDELCRAIGYSREHVSRSFAAEYGESPKQYFDRRRINTGIAQLSNGIKVGEIAEHLGYANPYSFSKAFKRHCGLSPEHYRKAFPIK
ncbi:MAG: helix-turn-helix transcriptional regulator [Clostridia bacterium]|nr:helix-turn-helix transcriptional regulator [Clostridia bacterium]